MLTSTPAPLRYAMLIAFATFVILLSITPDHSRPDDSLFAWLLFQTDNLVQKGLHVLMYAALAMLLNWSLEHMRSKSVAVALGLSLPIGLGIFLEWCQTLIPGRYGTLTDIILNTVGAVAGTLIARRLIRSAA